MRRKMHQSGIKQYDKLSSNKIDLKKRGKKLVCLSLKNLFLNWMVRCYPIIFCSYLPPWTTFFSEYLKFKVRDSLEKAINGTCISAHKEIRPRLVKTKK
jgi:hypothetical protein